MVLACRSEAKTLPVLREIVAETGNEAVEFLPLDLGDLKSARRAADELNERGTPIDVLVANAGLAGQPGVGHQDVDRCAALVELVGGPTGRLQVAQVEGQELDGLVAGLGDDLAQDGQGLRLGAAGQHHTVAASRELGRRDSSNAGVRACDQARPPGAPRWFHGGDPTRLGSRWSRGAPHRSQSAPERLGG